jgi:hypothetical protein
MNVAKNTSLYLRGNKSTAKKRNLSFLGLSAGELLWGYTLLPVQVRLLSHAHLKAGADLT